jgi:hypothetical protein
MCAVRAAKNANALTKAAQAVAWTGSLGRALDKSFVQSPGSAAIVDAVISMGLSLGMQIVAEGVEKQDQVSCCG